jgi:hypothetical protein
VNINWDIVIKIVVPLGTLVLGRFLDRWLTKKPRLISYLGHVSSFTLSDQNRTPVFTHAIVIRNAGREASNNVRVGHYVLPDYQLSPSISHRVEQIQTGGAEIVIPKLVPGEQVTISYLYFPPLTWDRVNAYAKSDEGLARILTVIPMPQPQKWVLRLIWFLILVGIVTLIYLAIEVVLKFFG